MEKIKLIDGTAMTLDELAVPDSHGTPRIMTLLREKQLNPENIPEKLLHLKDKSGTSVLDLCIERFREPVIDSRGQTVPRALFLAGKSRCGLPRHFREIKEILSISGENGLSVIHLLAKCGKLPEESMTEETLQLTDRNGCSIAYYVAKRDILPDWAKRRKDILLLENEYGDYVAHVLAQRGHLPSEMMTEDILKLKNRDGCFVAYHVAKWDFLPDWAKKRKDILLLENGYGDFVAHVLAWQGKLPEEMMTEDILKLKNKDGCAVAYKIVWSWHDSFPDWAKHSKDILLLGNGCGDYVAHVLARHGHYLRK